jgi:NRAMP (natural resistance-associated macrophage protein)-like metal ion transporter
MARTQTATQKTIKKAEREIVRTERHAKNIAKSILNYKRFNRFLRILGPGVVTGAADDDPSGIATYSQAGALYGFGLLWLFPFMFPLLLAVQESCARIGAITGKGLAAVIRDNYNRKFLYGAVTLVLIANVINIGADLGAMAATTQLFVNVSFTLLAVLYAVVILALVIFVQYKTYTRILKWLALALLAYPITAILVGQDWGNIVHATLHPSFTFNSQMLYIVVGMLGTTISPYLFFWDTSEVVEDEIVHHRLAENAKKEPKITKRFMHNLRLDNFTGMFMASITAWFIVIVCASVLNANGITEINTASDAARALEPLVKEFPNSGLVAKLIFSVGIIGLGLLAVPVLAGSSSYAISESLHWKEGLHRKFRRAVGFYGVIIVATLVGLAINFLGIDPIKALVFSAVFNGVAAVPLLLLIAKIGNNKEIMGSHKNGLFSNLFVRIAFIVMFAASLFMFYALIKGL